MQRHLVLTTELEFEEIIFGKSSYLVRFFKKRLEFLSRLSSGDLVYLKVGKEVLGEFNVGKVVLIEKFDGADFGIYQQFSRTLKKADFEKKSGENSIIVIIQIQKLEQFITSPIEVPLGKREWLVLG